MKKGFTLIELLVVVLIIGILSAIALPQYTKSVEKSHAAEVLINIKTIKDGFNLFLLSNAGRPSTSVCFKDMGTGTELTGGTWDTDSCKYTTKNFEYNLISCSRLMCDGEISRVSNGTYYYTLVLDDRHDHENHVDSCYTNETDIGRFICKSLQSLGWRYVDEVY